jgi:hypothetical protein
MPAKQTDRFGLFGKLIMFAKCDTRPVHLSVIKNAMALGNGDSLTTTTLVKRFVNVVLLCAL